MKWSSRVRSQSSGWKKRASRGVVGAIEGGGQVEAVGQEHLGGGQARQLDAEVGVGDLGGAELARCDVDVGEAVTRLRFGQTAAR